MFNISKEKYESIIEKDVITNILRLSYKNNNQELIKKIKQQFPEFNRDVNSFNSTTNCLILKEEEDNPNDYNSIYKKISTKIAEKLSLKIVEIDLSTKNYKPTKKDLLFINKRWSDDEYFSKIDKKIDKADNQVKLLLNKLNDNLDKVAGLIVSLDNLQNTNMEERKSLVLLDKNFKSNNLEDCAAIEYATCIMHSETERKPEISGSTYSFKLEKNNLLEMVNKIREKKQLGKNNKNNKNNI